MKSSETPSLKEALTYFSYCDYIYISFWPMHANTKTQPEREIISNIMIIAKNYLTSRCRHHTTTLRTDPESLDSSTSTGP